MDADEIAPHFSATNIPTKFEVKSTLQDLLGLLRVHGRARMISGWRCEEVGKNFEMQSHMLVLHLSNKDNLACSMYRLVSTIYHEFSQSCHHS